MNYPIKISYKMGAQFYIPEILKRDNVYAVAQLDNITAENNVFQGIDFTLLGISEIVLNGCTFGPHAFYLAKIDSIKIENRNTFEMDAFFGINIDSVEIGTENIFGMNVFNGFKLAIINSLGIGSGNTFGLNAFNVATIKKATTVDNDPIAPTIDAILGNNHYSLLRL